MHQEKKVEISIDRLRGSTHSTPSRGYGSINGIPLSSDHLGRARIIDDPTIGSLPDHAILTNDPALVAARTSDWPVHSMEALTRQIVLVCIAYMVGASYPQYLHEVARATEFAVTAWVTCIAIFLLSFIQRRFPHLVLSERDRYNLMVAAGAVVDDHEVLGPTGQMSDEMAPLLRRTPYQDVVTDQLTTESKISNTPIVPRTLQMDAVENVAPYETEQQVETIEDFASPDDTSVASSTKEEPSSVHVEHPSLAPFYVIDSYSGERVYCNASKPHHISNEWFDMQMLVLIRTPDVDDPSNGRGTAANEKVADYMRSKQRRFEFQYRVRLKKKPVGKQVYFSCELEEPIKMGIVTKAFVGAAMAFMKSTNPTFHYSVTGSKESSDGRYEKPHMSFTVEGSLDRLVVTKPGQKPPELGKPIHEDPESIKRRKKGVLIDWNTKDTYTMALWSAYVDFLDWKVLNLPGIRPFGLSSVLASQPIYLTMYLIEDDRDNDKHYRKDISEIIKIELSNDVVSAKGPDARKWLQTHGRQKQVQISSAAPSTISRDRSGSEDSSALVRAANAESEAGDEIIELKNSNTIDEEMEDIDEIDEDVVTAAELGEGIYLQSGDSVVLRESPADDENSAPYSVANGGGFAVLQEQDVTIIIEKAKRKKNKLIKSGDTVIFKMIQTKGGTDDIETRYLTIHRGWWLKWVTSMPTKNGYFTIYAQETELGDKGLPADGTQSSFLTMGGSFILRHKRWSKFYVGIASEASTTYGGII